MTVVEVWVRETMGERGHLLSQVVGLCPLILQEKKTPRGWLTVSGTYVGRW